MSDEFEQLVAQFEQFQAKLTKAADQFGDIERMQSELTALEAGATSADRSVTVIAGPGGSIKDIQFTDNALKQRPQALSAVLMSTLQQAVANAARKQAEIVSEHAGGGLNLLDQVLETQAEALGTSVEALRSQMTDEAAASRPAAPRRPAAPDGDPAEFNIMRPATDTPSAPPSPPQPPPSTGSAGDQFLKRLYDD